MVILKTKFSLLHKVTLQPVQIFPFSVQLFSFLLLLPVLQMAVKLQVCRGRSLIRYFERGFS